MLRLITGGSGCGKTYHIYQRLRELVDSGKQPILLVPEQYSFESERAMLKLLGARKATNVQVYSFTRLADSVSRLAGGHAGKKLDDCGRVAAMGIALSQIKGELQYYKGKRSFYFIEHLLDAVKEFKLCALSPEQIALAAQKTDGTLRKKLSELAVIYAAYNAVTERTAFDPLDDLDRLFYDLEQVRFFEGKTVLMDSFRGFTGQELRITSRILQQAELCEITLCAEESGSEAEQKAGLFATSVSTLRTLRSLAKESGAGLLPQVRLDMRRRFVSPALETMESSIFRCGEQHEAYPSPTSDITIYEASDRYDELEYCAAECRRLLREEGYRCRDIAIIARNEQVYSDIAADALELQDIPHFTDTRINASCSALMQFVLSALDTVRGGRQTDDILRWLKCGLIKDISASDIAQLENYCYVWRVRAADWQKPFSQNPNGFEPCDPEKAQATLAVINRVRERAMALLDPFCQYIKTERGASMAKAVYLLLEKSGTAQMLDGMAAKMSPTAAAEQPQLWNLLMSILDQLSDIIGDTYCSVEDFCAYVTLMISRADIGHLPRGLDEITFGAADRIRVNSPRAVFIVGALEGEFPAAPSSCGVFTDDERKKLRLELELSVAEPFEQQLLEERLLCYSALTAASERLYICYPAAGDSDAVFPSECIAEVMSCVPNCRVIKAGQLRDPAAIGSAAAAFELYARCKNDNSEYSASLAACLKQRPEWSGRMKAAEHAASDSPNGISRSRSAQMFKTNMWLSSSKAECFHLCRYRFFCRYGLGITPRRRAALDRLQFGTVAHYVLEHIFAALGDRPFSALSDDPDGVARRVSELIEDYIDTQIGGREGKSSSFLHQLANMSASLTALVLNLAAELSVSDFRPVAYELSIAPDGDVKPARIDAGGGISASVIGRVDRVDCYQSGSKTYLRIIDYKTGQKAFRLSDVLYGLNMQMLIYLDEICSDKSGAFSSASPAGILYCPAFPGSISDSRSLSEGELCKKQRSALRRSGLIIDDTDDHVIGQAMENGLGGSFIPVTQKQNGELSQSSKRHVITPSAYKLIGRYVRHTIRNMCGVIARGELAPDPITDGFDPCAACDYYAVCRYDGAMRIKKKADNDAALLDMAAQLGEEKEGN